MRVGRANLVPILVILILGASSIAALYALDVVVDQLEGDVEVKQGKADWAAATAGMKLSAGDQISTGFDSKLILKFEDNSVVTVKPLTQFTIDRFFKDEAAIHTDLAVKIGAVRAKVNRTADTASDFVVITPTSVVSVRGTEEEVRVTEKATDVNVIQGVVKAENERGQPASIAKGQEAQMEQGKQVVSPVEKLVEKSRTNTVSGFGLTEQEIQITGQYTSPTFDPGGASTGQSNPTATSSSATTMVVSTCDTHSGC